jgi:Na+/H+ antiporter NhaD/arsenite permease-like protein
MTFTQQNVQLSPAAVRLETSQVVLAPTVARRARPYETFDVMSIIQRAEWDTLLFFYGIILCVGGLATIGYLSGVSQALYGGLGPTMANTIVGIISAVVDNIPVMFAILNMSLDMNLTQWLLVTMTAGVGGSMLSVGSAAGVALMGQARGQYTFMKHLKWSWAIALGYAASIAVHLLING